MLDGEKLFSLVLEGQPLSGASDYSLCVISQPLEVVANIPLLDRLRMFAQFLLLGGIPTNFLKIAGCFFTPEETLSFAGFASVADKFNTIKEMTHLQLLDALHHHKTIDLSMDVKVK